MTVSAAPRAHARPRSALLRLVLSIPVLGWMLRDAMYGREDAKVWGLLTLAGLVALAVVVWGYAALIVVYLTLTALALVGLIVISRA